MAITVMIPTALRNFTDRRAEIEVSGANVGEVLAALTQKYPDLNQHLYQGEALRSFVNVFVGDTNIKKLDGLGTGLKDGDAVMLVPAIAGGTGESG
ncbi:MAG: MoaD family protein [Spirochaetaceae bacterium]|jgi:adenylyltransferase/sulfurtransferase|nr:MoaD family protein [Spirochaetaceae bacterium]